MAMTSTLLSSTALSGKAVASRPFTCRGRPARTLVQRVRAEDDPVAPDAAVVPQDILSCKQALSHSDRFNSVVFTCRVTFSRAASTAWPAHCDDKRILETI